MAKTTTHYSLAKPDKTDYYDVAVFNTNADTVDEQLWLHASSVNNPHSVTASQVGATTLLQMTGGTGATVLTNADDLDDKTNGVYVWGAESLPDNAPSESGGTATCYRLGTTSGEYAQVVLAEESEYTRYKTDGAWSSWRAVAYASAKIVVQPVDVEKSIGEYAEFSVKATGDGLTYEWYYKSVGTSAFKKSSTTTSKYRLETTEARNGLQAYCVVTDRGGNTVTSNTVTMTVAT